MVRSKDDADKFISACLGEAWEALDEAWAAAGGYPDHVRVRPLLLAALETIRQVELRLRLGPFSPCLRKGMEAGRGGGLPGGGGVTDV